eukprot:5323970-Pleurochrysis_carterae.AAC.1
MHSLPGGAVKNMGYTGMHFADAVFFDGADVWEQESMGSIRECPPLFGAQRVVCPKLRLPACPQARSPSSPQFSLLACRHVPALHAVLRNSSQAIKVGEIHCRPRARPSHVRDGHRRLTVERGAHRFGGGALTT